MPGRGRRWNGWGFEGGGFVISPELDRWLRQRLSAGIGSPPILEEDVSVPVARAVGRFPCEVADDRATRLRHAVGMSFPDIIRLRRDEVARFPDAVAFPAASEEVLPTLQTATRRGFRVVVRGGGTSVVGGVTIPPGERPVLVLCLDRLEGLSALDEESLLATFKAGTYGPSVEATLATHGLTLGHEPQSFELSTVGGWVAARSAGQRSTGIGKIEDLLAGAEVVTPHHRWRLSAQPASAAGPDLRHVVLGSEGRLGVITEATLRVRRLPEAEDGLTVLAPTWEAGIDLTRALLQAGNPVEILRLSDPTETSMALAVAHLPTWARRGAEWVLSRRRYLNGCLLLLGWTGSRFAVTTATRDAREICRAAGAVALGRRGWKTWLRDRFRHPYLRDALLDVGWGIDTLETAAPWSSLRALYATVRRALSDESTSAGVPVVTLCHLSHAYADGASLYFTFLWPLSPGEEVEVWHRLKRSATEALVSAGGTVSHHHGVGSMHAPWLRHEVGAAGDVLLRAMIRAADPDGALNTGILLEDPSC